MQRLMIRTTPEDLSRRVSEAIKRRLVPGVLTMKGLAYALDVSEQTVWSWVAGAKTPSGPMLVNLIALFDPAFGNEIFAGTGAQIVKLNAAKLARIRAVADHALQVEIYRASEAAE